MGLCGKERKKIHVERKKKERKRKIRIFNVSQTILSLKYTPKVPHNPKKNQSNTRSRSFYACIIILQFLFFAYR